MNRMRQFVESLKNVSHKQLWLGAAVAAAGLFFWLAVFWAMSARTASVLIIVAILIGGLMWIVLSLLGFMFLDRKTLFLVFGFLILVLLVSFGLFGLNWVGIFLFGLAIWFTSLRVRQVRSFLSKFKAVFILRKSMPVFFTGLGIALAFFYHSLVIVNIVEDERDIHFTPQVYRVVFAPVDWTLDAILPGYYSGITVGEFQRVLLNSFIANFLPGIGPMDDSETGPVFNQFQDNGSTDQTVEMFTREWLNDSIRAILEPYREFVPALFIVGLFLAIRLILWPVMWLSLLMALIAIKILLWYNILTLKKEEVEQEQVKLI